MHAYINTCIVNYNTIVAILYSVKLPATNIDFFVGLAVGLFLDLLSLYQELIIFTLKLRITKSSGNCQPLFGNKASCCWLYNSTAEEGITTTYMGLWL